MFALLNEPRGAATTARMNALYPEVMTAIRKVSPKRTILLSPGDWGSVKAVAELRISSEWENVVVTAHCYEPFLFTHQGAGCTGGLTGTTGIVFPGPPLVPVVAANDGPERTKEWARAHNTAATESNLSRVPALSGLLAEAAVWWRRE